MGAIEGLAVELADLANGGIAPRVLSEVFALIYAGMVRQIANVPIDLRIETWLYREHPALREVQRRSLLGQLREGVQALAPQIERVTPPTVFRASNAMNCAFARGLMRMYDDPTLAAPYRDTAFWEPGGALLALVDATRDDAEGDMAVVDRWAEILGVRGWYRWALLDSIPPSDPVAPI